MAVQNKLTTDHETIRAWAEERGGIPMRNKDTMAEGAELIFVHVGPADPELEKISWDRFFDIFEEHRLAFLYQDETEEGEESAFCMVTYREDETLGGTKKKKKLATGDDDTPVSAEEEEDEDLLEEDEGYDADDEEDEEM